MEECSVPWGLVSRGLTTSQSAKVSVLSAQDESEEEAVGCSSLGRTDPGNLGMEGTAEGAASEGSLKDTISLPAPVAAKEGCREKEER